MFEKINIFKSIGTGFVGLSLIIDSVIYELVSKTFELFIVLAKATVFDNEIVNDIMYKCYALVGIIMLFVLVFAIIQNIFNPENAFSGDKGINKVVTNIIKSLILVALVPIIFDLGYGLQNAIITDNIIGRIFLGQDNNYGTVNISSGEKNEEGLFVPDEEVGTETLTGENVLISQGNQLAFSVYNGFINPENYTHYNFDAGDYKAEAEVSGIVALFSCIGTGLSAGATVGLSATVIGATLAPATAHLAVGLGAICISSFAIFAGTSIANVFTLENYTWQASVARAVTGDFKGFTPFAEIIMDGDMTYMPIISAIVGLALLYIIFSFCLDLGVRAVKLAFYEMIAPIPIFLSTLPGKSDLLKNWAKAVLATFMEVIIRLLIIYLIVYFASNIKLNIEGNALVTAIIIMGIVVFAKQLPKLISDITGIDSGNIKLGIGEKLADGGLFTAGAALGSSATSAIRNAHSTWKKTGRIGATFGSIIGGAGSGLVRGGKAGLKAKNFSEMKQSAGEGAAATTAARDRRASRKINRANKIGQAKDAYRAGRYGDALGILSRDAVGAVKTFVGGGLEKFKAEQALYSSIRSEDDAIDSLSTELLERDAIAGSAEITNAVDANINMSLIAMKNLMNAERPENGIAHDFAGNEIVISNDTDWANYKARLTTEYNRIERGVKNRIKTAGARGEEGIIALQNELHIDLGDGEIQRLEKIYNKKENIKRVMTEDQAGIAKLNQELERNFISGLKERNPDITQEEIDAELEGFRESLIDEISDGEQAWDNIDRLITNIKHRENHIDTEAASLKRQADRRGGNNQQ